MYFLSFIICCTLFKNSKLQKVTTTQLVSERYQMFKAPVGEDGGMGWNVICAFFEHYLFPLHLEIKYNYQHWDRQTEPRCCCGYYWMHQIHFRVSHLLRPACRLSFVPWCPAVRRPWFVWERLQWFSTRDCRNESFVKTIVTFSLLCTWACNPETNKYIKKQHIHFLTELTCSRNHSIMVVKVLLLIAMGTN